MIDRRWTINLADHPARIEAHLVAIFTELDKWRTFDRPPCPAPANDDAPSDPVR